MCDLVERLRVTLQPEPASVSLARRLIARAVCPSQAPESRDTAILLVSELVTNAIRHGGPPVLLEIDCDPGHVLQVRVSDAGPGRPVLSHARPDDDHGRGLDITAILSDEWGIDPDDGGKTVWFRLRPTLG